MDGDALRMMVPYPLVALRLAPIIAFAPPFLGELLPARVRLGLIVLLTAVVAPRLAASAEAFGSATDFGAAASGELLVGATLALLLRVAFEVAGAVGAWIDVVRGATASQILDPLSRAQVSPLQTLLSYGVVTAFVVSGGHRQIVSGIIDSYVVAPLGVSSLFGSGTSIEGLIDFAAGSFVIAIGIAAPIIVTIFLVDVGLAFVNRAAQQVQVLSLGFVVKPVLGVALTAVIFAWVLESCPEIAGDVLARWCGSR